MIISTNPKNRQNKRKQFKREAHQALELGDFDGARRFVKLFSMHITTDGDHLESSIEQQQWASRFLAEINLQEKQRGAVAQGEPANQ